MKLQLSILTVIPDLCRLCWGHPVHPSDKGRLLRPLWRIALILCAAVSAAACTEIVDSAVESRYAQYNYSTDWAKNEAILLNIVRASEYQPLNFMGFQPYQGTASVSGTASSPAFVVGPARASSQKQYTFGQGSLTASASGTGTVTVTSLETSDFYNSLLSPVDYVNLNAFQRQGYPRELLFRLFADYVSLKPAGNNPKNGLSYIVYNDPSPLRSCFPPSEVEPANDAPRTGIVCFDDLVQFALLSGLSSEVRTITTSSGGGGAKAPSPAPAAPAGKTQNTQSTPPNPQTEGRLCFDPALSARAIIEYQSQHGPLPDGIKKAEYHPICGGTGPDEAWPTTSTKTTAPAPKPKAVAAPSPAPPHKEDASPGAPVAPAVAPAAHVPPATPTPAKPVTAAGAKPSPGVELLTVKVFTRTNWPVWDLHLGGQHYSIEIGTRSTFSIYNFLGSLLRNPASHANQLIGPPDEDNDRFVLTVVKGQPIGCFSTAILELGVYCVPLDGAANTKRTFSILSQLLALKTTTDDLQLLPTIRLLPTQ